nr:serine/threonine-protein kinase WNK4 isoform X2 [Ipomoea batatas]GMC93621.1 serine/threonine-protein kinase WNK4 isoform X2 [Ipomoea batatas]GMC97461.1 serine/threonine-protein kinase WNK4 isoform X2 [Ipomoea batatas]GMC99571.1 serine/threonine-protein kinase WNK4 isoform X2 [Ipomoea batatas]
MGIKAKSKLEILVLLPSCKNHKLVIALELLNSWLPKCMKRITMSWLTSILLGCAYWKWSHLNTHTVSALILLRSTRKSCLEKTRRILQSEGSRGTQIC